MAGLTTESLAYKLPRALRDVYSGYRGPNLSLVQILGGYQIQAYRIADADAGTNYVFSFMVAPVDLYLVAARLHPHAALTADASHYKTVTIQTVEGTPDVKGTIVTTVAGSGNWALNTPEEFTIGDALISAGDVIALATTKTGNGVVVPAGIVELDVVPR